MARTRTGVGEKGGIEDGGGEEDGKGRKLARKSQRWERVIG